jgi:2-oxoglutarate ferredoxin oxidoreductase subunit alpha
MTKSAPVKKGEKSKSQKRIVNDFSITVGTMNGSGSQTSNLTLLRALFKMGIPVSGKNLFPSNIQGLPTWYTIRVSKHSYTARRDQHEIVVAMNAPTAAEDLAKVEPGGAFFYADHLKIDINRDDIAIYSFPAKELAKKSEAPANLRDYVANMAYVGVLAFVLGIHMDKLKMALDYHFRRRERPVNMNYTVIEAAFEWAKENIEKKDPFYVEEMDLTKDFIMADGNTAAALGSIYGGLQFSSWYPITPASSLSESLTHYIAELRENPNNGDRNYAIIQTEDELSAIGMAVGAGWAGLRAMTATCGPGLALMTEFVGLAYYSETPVVIWDVTRVGPSTGLPTRTSQGDLGMMYKLGHGDTENIVLIPSTPQECFEFGWRSFDIAERIQTPVFVMSDLDLGMNHWMTNKFEYPDQPMDRGKILWEEDLEKLKDTWGRYLDVDGDGIPYRTLPGNKSEKAPWFARGTGHDEYARYSEDPETWEQNMERLKEKLVTAKQYLPKPELVGKGDAKIGIIAYGSTEPAILEAQDLLADEGVKTDFLRVKSLPLGDEVQDFIERHERVYVVELNRDGQLHEILLVDFPNLCGKLISLTKHDGMPLTAGWVTQAILVEEK